MNRGHLPLRGLLRPGIVLLALLGGTWIARSEAQSVSGCAEALTHPLAPPLPVQPPRPPSEVAGYVEGVTSRDATFEVVVGQARVLTLKDNVHTPHTIGVGDPSVVDFNVLNPRQIRLVGQRIGVTDLSILTDGNKVYNFEVNVVADLDLLRSRLRAAFPDAVVRLSQMRDHVILEGEARDTTQVARILETVRAFLASVRATELRKIRAQRTGLPSLAAAAVVPPGAAPAPATPTEPGLARPGTGVSPELVPLTEVIASVAEPQIINLLRVPGSHQVLLKVRVAELNRTAMREIGADFLAIDHDTGAIVGTQIGGATVNATGIALGATMTGSLAGAASNAVSPKTTAFGIFPKGDFDVFFSALRRNSLLKILAEPNLMAMNGHQASFLAGGRFPVPVAQSSSGGAAPAVTVQFEKFGVELEFTPFILDNDTIRLAVHPTVSSIDFTLGTILVPGGSPVPGLNERSAQTTVELHEGQTLAIAGLLQLTLDGQTTRIPGLGDLPILGPFFSNTTGDRVEKELIILVTPYLVEPLNGCDLPPSPGDEVVDPTDLEFYLLNRIEGHTTKDFRSTTDYEEPLRRLDCFMKLQKQRIHGNYGYCP